MYYLIFNLIKISLSFSDYNQENAVEENEEEENESPDETLDNFSDEDFNLDSTENPAQNNDDFLESDDSEDLENLRGQIDNGRSVTVQAVEPPIYNSEYFKQTRR